MKKWMAIGVMAFAIVAADASITSAQDSFVDENGDGVDDGAARNHRFGRRGLRGVRAQLIEDQRVEVKAALETLKESDATREEIHAALGTMLEGFGVEVPDRTGGLSSVLTEDQLTELRTEIDALKETDASREDVRAAFEAKLGEFGVDPSTIQHGKRGGQGGPGKFRGRRGGFRGPAPVEAAPAADDAS
jgi:hypothetical protein